MNGLQVAQRRYDQENGIDEKPRRHGDGTTAYLYDYRSEYIGGLPRLSAAQKAVYREMTESGHYGNGAPEYVASFWESAKLGIADTCKRTAKREIYAYKIDAWDRQNYPQLRGVETLVLWRTIGTRSEYGYRALPVKCIACNQADCVCEV